MSETKPRRTQAERTAISDQRMFDAAMELISEQGANRTTLRQICEHAGYSRGLANYRFGSKDVFLQQLLVHFNREWTRKLDSHTAGKQGLDAYDAAVDALEQFLLDHSAYMRGGYLIWYESVGGNNAVRAGLQANHNAYRQETRHWIEQGQRLGQIRPEVNAEQFAVLYCSVVFGTVYQWLAAPDSIDLKQLFSHWRLQSAILLG